MALKIKGDMTQRERRVQETGENKSNDTTGITKERRWNLVDYLESTNCAVNDNQ